MTTLEQFAIKFEAVSKIYKLYGSQGDQLVDVLGLQRFGFRTRQQPKIFPALSDISIAVPRGHRIGIIGRNGAGKTTLLKLVCGNFSPTHGSVSVNGEVQALMAAGLGFHPEHTGRENVEASLQYNGLRKDEYRDAVEGIIEFCELGDFFDQPIKTYSLGMLARLMFAAATAIRPEILIVDEVLGAGDAYFVAKSKARVEALVRSGCTMLLVSHSMPQVLELCSEVIWLHEGKIRMQGDAFAVVKAYEEFVHGGGDQRFQAPVVSSAAGDDGAAAGAAGSVSLPARSEKPADGKTTFDREVLLQEPHFAPHATAAVFPAIEPPRDFKFVARGGLSRWASSGDLKLSGFTMVTERGETNRLMALAPAKLVLNVVAYVDGDFECRYGIVVLDYLGACRAKLISPPDKFSATKGQERCVEMLFNPVQLGPGEYVVSLSIHGADHLAKFNGTVRHDLLSRSFDLIVEVQESLVDVSADFFHSAEWQFAPDQDSGSSLNPEARHLLDTEIR
ncbi:ABC transporter ATP-binding protein [Bradyrhizobium sp. UFLA06-06]